MIKLKNFIIKNTMKVLIIILENPFKAHDYDLFLNLAKKKKKLDS